ncbi:Hpt domain-containing protein [Bacteroidota bacterium]
MEKPNLSYIKELSGGDLDFEAEIITVFKNEFPQELIAYKNSCENNDLKKTAEIVHKLKHKLSILGLEKGYEAANQYELDLNNNIAGTGLKFDQLLEEITEYLKKI